MDSSKSRRPGALVSDSDKDSLLSHRTSDTSEESGHWIIIPPQSVWNIELENKYSRLATEIAAAQPIALFAAVLSGGDKLNDNIAATSIEVTEFATPIVDDLNSMGGDTSISLESLLEAHFTAGLLPFLRLAGLVRARWSTKAKGSSTPDFEVTSKESDNGESDFSPLQLPFVGRPGGLTRRQLRDTNLRRKNAKQVGFILMRRITYPMWMI
ncbi:unnamed protein product [Protopolystoma xenopodis]|uniref:Uncharacterized protein n=1 Tax=Protopolystoma xenopodis TaxID=117903 RepID=A0A448WQD0_9PLAT|nr:unnamed protein product [Protopolystoma xenopodis]